MTHADLIKRALDAGAHGIVVPQINTAEEDKAVVSHSKFPPQGLRGQGSAFPPSLTVGVENVDSICAVPGVDMVFIGPNDLAWSILGYVPAKGSEPSLSMPLKRSWQQPESMAYGSVDYQTMGLPPRNI
ncbi:hypothetical protein ETB97_005788 [Aspergillus alliaceus]|uniref:HpcH/HpaI aldolase/citrate lyase domain-containing protein n=1 Tax=Petromyces alliaceus TaxID=209559 RepID=A0A8H5ZZQ5_PETAA|nr:hypothetical protein ETB97_005788 [Aspergillus burnettii]